MKKLEIFIKINGNFIEFSYFMYKVWNISFYGICCNMNQIFIKKITQIIYHERLRILTKEFDFGVCHFDWQ